MTIRWPLFRLPMARAMRFRHGILPIAGWIFLAILGARAIAFDAQDNGALGISDDVALSWLAALVIPFVAYSATGAALAKRRLDDAAAPLVMAGASRVEAHLANAVAAAAVSAVAAALATVVALASVHDARMDIFTSTWIAALAGASYGALFTFGAAFGRRAGGRTFVLAFDLIVGSFDGPISVVAPRAHLRNLFGGTAPNAISQSASIAALVAILAITLAAIALRARRIPRVYAV